MQALLVFHNLLRWLILIFGIWTVIGFLSGLIGKRNYTSSDDRSNFLFMLSMDVQFVLGLILYFLGSWFDRLKNMGDTMKDASLRFFTVEHAFVMILAWILVHVGRVSVKKATTPAGKFRRGLVFFGISLVLILIAIPWPFKPEVPRPWFRWF